MNTEEVNMTLHNESSLIWYFHRVFFYSWKYIFIRIHFRIFYAYNKIIDTLLVSDCFIFLSHEVPVEVLSLTWIEPCKR